MTVPFDGPVQRVCSAWGCFAGEQDTTLRITHVGRAVDGTLLLRVEPDNPALPAVPAETLGWFPREAIHAQFTSWLAVSRAEHALESKEAS